MNLKKKTKTKIEKPIGKRELASLKATYKSGKLNFESKKIANAILKDFKSGFTK